MNCEMCGKNGPLSLTQVEGATLNLCTSCSKLGRVIQQAVIDTKTAQKQMFRARPVIVEPELRIVSDFSQRIRKAREKTGLTQKEFALKVNEKESIIHKLETGEHILSIDEARKLEKQLHLTLIEETQLEKHAKSQMGATDSMTIGDMMKKK